MKSYRNNCRGNEKDKTMSKKLELTVDTCCILDLIDKKGCVVMLKCVKSWNGIDKN
jgi:hypothetical protein